MASTRTAVSDGLAVSESEDVKLCGRVGEDEAKPGILSAAEQHDKPRKAFSSGALSQISTDSSSLGEASPYDGVPHGVSWETCGTPAATADRAASEGSSGSIADTDASGSSSAGDVGSAAGGGLALRAGVAEIPHPDKVSYGGEDSWFLCDDGSAMGVADGVSEWGWRFGLNPRHFAQELMDGARAAAAVGQAPAAAGEPLAAQDRAAAALAAGMAGVRSFGAATSLVLVLDAEGGEVGVANIGDCSFRLLRMSLSDGRMQVVARTAEQMHDFSKPFQLALIPRSSDFPRLRAEGKNELVQAVKRCHSTKPDTPADAKLYTFEVLEGDLIIIGSDGLFDNVCDAELCRLVGEAGCAVAGDIADRLARAASERMAEPAGAPNGADAAEGALARPLTPLAARARSCGMAFSGGVQDDITVLAAVVAKRA